MQAQAPSLNQRGATAAPSAGLQGHAFGGYRQAQLLTNQDIGQPAAVQVPTTPLTQNRALTTSGVAAFSSSFPGGTSRMAREVPQMLLPRTTPSSAFREVNTNNIPAVLSTPTQHCRSPLMQNRIVPVSSMAQAMQAGMQQPSPTQQNRSLQPALATPLQQNRSPLQQNRSLLATPQQQTRTLGTSAPAQLAGPVRGRRGVRPSGSQMGPSRNVPGTASVGPTARRLGITSSPSGPAPRMIIGAPVSNIIQSPLAQSRVITLASMGDGASNIAPLMFSPTMSVMRTIHSPNMVVAPMFSQQGYMQPSNETAEFGVDDFQSDLQISIANAVAMLPPSPPNTLSEFLDSVVAGELIPAMCHSETRMDTVRYWENRRVQNSLRRLLEALQELISPGNDLPASVLGSDAFDVMLNWACRSLPGMSLHSGGMDQSTFTKALAGLQAWPPEMSKEDHSEVFLALTVPNSIAVKGLRHGQTQAKELTKRMFQEGLARVPYNVPDFPVPTYMITPQELVNVNRSAHVVLQVAQEVASIFSNSQTGLDQVKDFFLCGLISLEEIQIALPNLVPQALVDEAIMKIIRTSSRHFTRHEWDKLVTLVRMNPEMQSDFQEPPLDREPDQPDLDSPPMRQNREPPLPPLTASPVPNVEPPSAWTGGGESQELWQPPSSSTGPAVVPPTSSPPIGGGLDSPPGTGFAARLAAAAEPHFGADSDSSPEPSGAANVGRPLEAGARTEPLPKREITEDPVLPIFAQECPARVFGSIVNWNSSVIAQQNSSLDAPSGHQADEGAGTPQHGSEQPPAVAAAEAAQALQPLGGRASLDGSDPVAWISLEMQSECHGPYLSLAFQRCCQLYEARGGDARAEARRELREPGDEGVGYGRFPEA